MINNWTFQGKIRFNPDPNKQAQKVYFSRKVGNKNSLHLTFNQFNVASSCSQKHLFLLPDERISFSEHNQGKKDIIQSFRHY